MTMPDDTPKVIKPRSSGGELPTDLITLTEAAERLGIRLRTIKYHVYDTKRLPHYERLGTRSPFVSAAEADALPRERGGWRGGRKAAS
jgi:predicted DNA-binding transcriptional regulator AlpA